MQDGMEANMTFNASTFRSKFEFWQALAVKNWHNSLKIAKLLSRNSTNTNVVSKPLCGDQTQIGQRAMQIRCVLWHPELRLGIQVNIVVSGRPINGVELVIWQSHHC